MTYLFSDLIWSNWPTVGEFYICITIGLFFCSFSFWWKLWLPHLLETSCPISYQCNGSDLAWGICVTNCESWYFSFFKKTHLAINLIRKTIRFSAVKGRRQCSLSSRAASCRQKYQNKCPSISQTYHMSASTIRSPSVVSISSV